MKRSKNNHGQSYEVAEAPCVLAAVVLTCRSRPHVAPLSHVIVSIDSYVNRIETKWTLERASMYQYVNLMDRFGKLEWRGVSSAFRQKRFMNGVTKAIQHSRLDVFKWWMTVYMPDHEFGIPEIQKCAIESNARNRFAMLKWLQTQDKLTLSNQQSVFEVKSGSDDLAVWLHDNVHGIKMKVKVGYDSSLAYIKWGFAHQKLYEIEGVAGFTYKVIRQGYPADCLPWLLEISSERLRPSLFNDVMRKVYKVDQFKLLYEVYPKHYFDDPVSASNCLKLIQWFLTEYEWKYDQARVAWIVKCMEEAACYYDGLEIIEYLYTVHPNTDAGSSMENAAWNNCLDIVQHLHARRANTKGSMHRAAQKGHLEVLKWLHEQQIEDCCTKAMDGAACGNQLSTIQWLHENRSEGCSAKAMSFALQQGHMEVVQWLHANRSEGCLPTDMDSLAASGDLKMLQWMHEHRTEGCTTDAMDKAAAGGHLEIVQFLHNNRTEGCTTKAMDKAARNGHLKVVNWLHVNRSEGCTTDAMDLAAWYGHLEVIKFLHANRTEGCTAKALHEVAYVNRSKVVKWLMTYRPEVCMTEDIAKALKVVAGRGDGQLVAWLIPKVSTDAVAAALTDAVETDSVSVVKRLITHCNPSHLRKALVLAASKNHFALVELMLKYQAQPRFAQIACPFA